MLHINQDFSTILNSLFDGAYCTDQERRITFWNEAAERMTGFSRDEVVGRCCADNILRHVDSQGRSLCKSDLCPLYKTISDGQTRETKLYLHHKEGHRIPVRVHCTPLHDPDGTIIGGLEFFSDISTIETLRARVEELERLTSLDHLTGLANRRHTEALLTQRLEEFHRYKWPFGVFMADIDHFKQVNDQHGHPNGDRVLRMVAQTLALNCRPFDVIGRWGGEEFFGIVRSVDQELFSEILERLRVLVKNCFIMDTEKTISVTASFGGTLAQNEDAAKSLIARADALLYKSKHTGRDCVTLDEAK